MNPQRVQRSGFIRWLDILVSFLLIFIVPGCSILPGLQKPSSQVSKPALADITFKFLAPPSFASDVVYLDLLDEVTGYSLNPLRYSMNKTGNLEYSLRLALPVGALIYYKYSIPGSPPVNEASVQGKDITYRNVFVENPAVISDLAGCFQESCPDTATGRITGKIISHDSEHGLADIMVSVAGYQTLTDWNGTFRLDNLPVGIHRLLVFDLNAEFIPFQQEVEISREATTPVVTTLKRRPMVNITFNVHPPQDEFIGAGQEMHLVGNLRKLGNSFSPLLGGMSILAEHSPVLERLPGGDYSTTVSLPAGAILRYKFTLGDGFWNAELNADGNLAIREILIPSTDSVVDNTIVHWITPGSRPLKINIKTPSETLLSDKISIQLNGFGWTQPLLMNAGDSHQWDFTLFSPIDRFSTLQYRICRNRLCDPEPIRSISLPASEDISINLETWAMWKQSSSPVSLMGSKVNPRGSGFITGVELSPVSDPAWHSSLQSSLKNIKDLGSNCLVLTPTRTLASKNPPRITKSLPADLLSGDEIDQISRAKESGLSVSLFPLLVYPQLPSVWWKSAQKDAAWWDTWFDQYQGFIMEQAALAEYTGVDELVIGDPGISPFLYESQGQDGVPDAALRMNNLLRGIRNEFHGRLTLAIPYPRPLDSLPEFAADVDAIYFLFSSQIRYLEDEELSILVDTSLDENIYPLVKPLKKPVIIGISYPSSTNAWDGCETMLLDCWDQNRLAEMADPVVDMQAQQLIYELLLQAVNTRPWISGVVSRGYLFSGEVEDSSASIHGKPAASVLWYWYPKLTSN